MDYVVGDIDRSTNIEFSQVQINEEFGNYSNECYVEIISECEDCILGDYNGDSELDILDVTSIVDFIIEGQSFNYDECSDINEDGYLNILDVMTLVYTILDN